MITLYVKKGCPHCAKVLDALHHDLSIDFNARYINNPEHAAVVKAGGKLQVPYLVDDATGVSLYESGDIIAYLEKEYQRKP